MAVRRWPVRKGHPGLQRRDKRTHADRKQGDKASCRRKLSDCRMDGFTRIGHKQTFFAGCVRYERDTPSFDFQGTFIGVPGFSAPTCRSMCGSFRNTRHVWHGLQNIVLPNRFSFR